MYLRDDSEVRGKIGVTATNIGGMYTALNVVSEVANVSVNISMQELWHERFPYLGRVGLDQLKNGMVTGMSYSDSDTNEDPCVTYIKGKQVRTPYNKCSMTRAMKSLELIHTDVYGPKPEESFNGA
ncbi:hypothetical protein PR048_020139 [Dryococelus australis]|uniref:Uncharacterized protein n=1 Tax=Dryococelus australis TaxID=614101 RepID=A0ABQ9H5P1_9NEOP|nr:hypothetical protein PR048_020139 [Dryococelus australis]